VNTDSAQKALQAISLSTTLADDGLIASSERSDSGEFEGESGRVGERERGERGNLYEGAPDLPIPQSQNGSALTVDCQALLHPGLRRAL